MFAMEGRLLRVLLIVSLINCVCSKTADKPIELTEDNWTQILEGEWMVEFMAPWCPACRSFKETWDSYAKWSKDLDVGVGVIDVTDNPGLSGRFFVTALPTIYYVRDGVFRQYHGSRQETDLVSFIDEKKWQDVEPVSAWFAPNSIQMATVGLFFKAAMVIRSFYNMMTTEYGIPEWGCYLIFALLTIVTGLVLGLLIVCCCDILFPPKYQTAVVPQRKVSDADGDTAEGDEKDGKGDDADLLDDVNENQEEESTTRRRHPQKDD